ncbi:hypothetical protein QBC44DRAFT_12416 [Cladorrhinum sp. PSN332]|nr:hypothetical protein QBC44DRAFT_12416 [Cladorrhinum sp. PSN332]
MVRRDNADKISHRINRILQPEPTPSVISQLIIQIRARSSEDTWQEARTETVTIVASNGDPITNSFPSTTGTWAPVEESQEGGDSTKQSTYGRLSAGAGAGITIGVLAFLMALCGVALCLIKRQSIKEATSTANKERFDGEGETGPLGEGRRVLRKLQRRLSRLHREQTFVDNPTQELAGVDAHVPQELSGAPSIQEMPDGTSEMIARAKTSNMLGDLDCGSPSVDWDATPVAALPTDPVELPVTEVSHSPPRARGNEPRAATL